MNVIRHPYKIIKSEKETICRYDKSYVVLNKKLITTIIKNHEIAYLLNSSHILATILVSP